MYYINKWTFYLISMKWLFQKGHIVLFRQKVEEEECADVIVVKEENIKKQINLELEDIINRNHHH
jgi:hypothetical protein